MMNSIWMGFCFTLCGWVESTDSSSYLTVGVCKQIFSYSFSAQMTTTISPSSLTNLSSSISNTASTENPWSNDSHAIIVRTEKQYHGLLTRDFHFFFYIMSFSVIILGCKCFCKMCVLTAGWGQGGLLWKKKQGNERKRCVDPVCSC